MRVEPVLHRHKLEDGPEVGVRGLALREHTLQAAEDLDVAVAADGAVDELVRLEAAIEPRLDGALPRLARVRGRIEWD